MSNGYPMDSSRFCVRIVDQSEVPAWHELRRQLALFDLDAMGWRVSDIIRRSVYENSNTGERDNWRLDLPGADLAVRSEADTLAVEDHTI